MKKAISLLLCLCMVLSLLPVEALAAEPKEPENDGFELIIEPLIGAELPEDEPAAQEPTGGVPESAPTAQEPTDMPEDEPAPEAVLFEMPGEPLSITITDENDFPGLSTSQWYGQANRIVSATIAEGVTALPNNAFYGAAYLQSVTLPSTLTSLGYNAFYGCKALTSIDIPNEVTSIGQSAFQGCKALRTVSLPSAWQDAGGLIFKGCESLTSITVPEGVIALPNNAFDDAAYLQSVTLPSTLTSIGYYAFHDCKALTSIDIPNGVTSIGQSAFSGCKALRTVSLPSAWQDVGGLIFDGCESLTSITVPEGVTALPNSAFVNAEYLQSVTLPSTLTSIGWSAFSGCKALTSINIPNGVTSIGSSAFKGCKALRTVSLPSAWQVASIDIFKGCESLTSITVPEGVTALPKNAFDGAEYLQSVTLPSTLTSIGWSAFHGCKALTSISIPNGITSIDYGVFENCTALRSISLPSTLTSIGYSVFSGCERLTDIYYADSEEQWKKTAIAAGNDLLKNGSVTIHYNSTGPVVRLAEMQLAAGEHALRIVNEEGELLEGALVTWDGGSVTSGADGIAKFMLASATTVTISCEGYLTQEYTVGGATLFENASEDTQKSSATDVVLANANSPLYVTYAYCGTTPEEAAKCNISRGKSGKDNTAKWFFTGGNSTFVLRTVASSPNDVASYALYRKRYEKVERVGNTWTSTSFVSFNTKDFSAGYDYFIRVTGKDGTTVDTRINLKFRDPPAIGSTIGIKDNKMTVELPDEVYFLGGTKFYIYLPIDSKLEYAVAPDKVLIGINIPISESASNEMKLSQIRKNVKILDAAHFDKRTLEALKATSKTVDFFGKCKFTVSGYLEIDASSAQPIATGKVAVSLDFPELRGSWFVPTTGTSITLSASASMECRGKAIHNFGDSLKDLTGNISADPGFKITVFAGEGYSEIVALGGYGSGKVIGDYVLLPASQAGFKTAKLTGQVGFAYYSFGKRKEYPLVSKTWQIIPWENGRAAGLMSSEEPFDPYDASQYHPADLSYLANESEWLGVPGASLMEAEARTRLTRLLEDTYRDARPVMLASGNALYAAFIRVDAETEARYVAVTKYSGGVWATPVRVDADAILDGVPTLCADGAGGVWLAYTKTADGADDSLLSYAQHQRVVVGHIGADELTFTPVAEFSPAESGGFVNSPKLALLSGGPALLWADSAVTDDNSVLRPATSLLRYATYNESWSSAQTLGTVNSPIVSLALGEADGTPAVAYTVIDDSGEETAYPLYRMTSTGTEKLADSVTGKLQWATLPGTAGADFVWNEDGSLASLNHDSVAVEGMTHEYAIVGNNIYFSRTSGNGADLAVIQYHAEEGGYWGAPIRLTDESDAEQSSYLENLHGAALNGQDYIFGMNTNPTITETDVIDKKDLVWSAIMPVSDLRLESVDFDAPGAGTVGKTVTATLTVTNAGDHVVETVAVTAAGETVNKTTSLKPGESAELKADFICPDRQTDLVFEVAEPGQDDYTPDDNSVTRSVACADAALTLDHVSVGKLRELEAIVTNEGVEPASGTVSFYNAEGGLLAARTFENLAPGGLVVARLTAEDATELFALGGDVSAEVVLDGTEEALWNNGAGKHISEPETSVVRAVIEGEMVSAEIYCAQEEGCIAFCASYNAEGKMTAISTASVAKGLNTTPLTCAADAAQVKIFLVDENRVPLCTPWVK